MHKTVVKRWVDALRSEKHTQCQGVLQDDAGRQCCLDVLIDIYNEDHEGDNLVSIRQRLNVRGGLPDQVGEWAGVHEIDQATWQQPVVNNELPSGWNDTAGLSFDAIADKLETHLLSE